MLPIQFLKSPVMDGIYYMVAEFITYTLSPESMCTVHYKLISLHPSEEDASIPHESYVQAPKSSPHWRESIQMLPPLRVCTCCVSFALLLLIN